MRQIRWMLALATLAFAQPDFRCGVERWTIKTGTDAGAAQINLTTPTPTTIAHLVQFPAPHPIPDTTRVDGPETTLWRITGTLTAFKWENDLHTGDSDYHLVIADDSGLTMIVEIPFSKCLQGPTPFSTGINKVRDAFNARFTASGDFQHVSVPVTVTGVGMFDFAHGQFGRSSNGIELHPLLDIVFNDTTPAPTPPPATGPPTTQLIGNPSFENGSNPAPWKATAGVMDKSQSEPAHSGAWKAWLGGTAKKHTDQLSQQVTIPASAAHATFSFWLRIDTDESGSQARDTMDLEVVDGASTTPLAQFSNVNASSFHKRSFDFDPFIGKTVTIRFTAKENKGNQTSFIVDDVALSVQ